jgi:raffinose/stachyose/melibiose transport system permease protein
MQTEISHVTAPVTFKRRNSYVEWFYKLTINGLLFIYVLTAIFPAFWMIYSSFKTSPEFALNIFSLPSSINFTNYQQIFEKGAIFRAYFNSIFSSVISVSLIVILSFSVAYFLARYRFPGRNAIYLFFMFGVLVPVYALLVPVFITFSKLD